MAALLFKRLALVPERSQLVVACLVSQLSDCLGNLRQGEALCLVDDRGEQATWGINCDSHVDVIEDLARDRAKELFGADAYRGS